MRGRQIAGIAAGIAGLALSVQAQNYNASGQIPPPTPTYNAPEQTTQPVRTYSTGEQAQPAPSENSWDHYGNLYHDQEVSVDLYGVGLLHSHDFANGTLARHNLKFGGGVGVNVFLTRYLGIGADMDSVSWEPSFVDTLTGNLIFRIPIENTGIAPYIFGGAGYQWRGIDQIVGGGGVGVEFRCCEHFSVFVDARYLAAVKTDGYGMGRAGIRLSF